MQLAAGRDGHPAAFTPAQPSAVGDRLDGDKPPERFSGQVGRARRLAYPGLRPQASTRPGFPGSEKVAAHLHRPAAVADTCPPPPVSVRVHPASPTSNSQPPEACPRFRLSAVGPGAVPVRPGTRGHIHARYVGGGMLPWQEGITRPFHCWAGTSPDACRRGALTCSRPHTPPASRVCSQAVGNMPRVPARVHQISERDVRREYACVPARVHRLLLGCRSPHVGSIHALPLAQISSLAGGPRMCREYARVPARVHRRFLASAFHRELPGVPARVHRPPQPAHR